MIQLNNCPPNRGNFIARLAEILDTDFGIVADAALCMYRAARTTGEFVQ